MFSLNRRTGRAGFHPLEMKSVDIHGPNPRRSQPTPAHRFYAIFEASNSTKTTPERTISNPLASPERQRKAPNEVIVGGEVCSEVIELRNDTRRARRMFEDRHRFPGSRRSLAP